MKFTSVPPLPSFEDIDELDPFESRAPGVRVDIDALRGRAVTVGDFDLLDRIGLTVAIGEVEKANAELNEILAHHGSAESIWATPRAFFHCTTESIAPTVISSLEHRVFFMAAVSAQVGEEWVRARYGDPSEMVLLVQWFDLVRSEIFAEKFADRLP